MKMQSQMRDQMSAGQLALGLGVGAVLSSAIPLVAKSNGYSWVFVDMEHSPMSMRDVAEISMSSLATGITPIVRIGRESIHDGSRALDNGAMGIMMPRVHTAEDAERLVNICKYAPIGERSWGGPSPQLGYPPRPNAELMAHANEITLTLALIESVEGVKNIEAISATPGLDAIFLGAVDLSIEMGYAGNVTHPDVVHAIARCADFAKAKNLFVGLGGVFGAEALTHYKEIQFNYVLAGIDYRLLNEAIGQRAALMRTDLAPSSP